MPETSVTERPLVVYFSAGAMAGVFSSGFSKALHEANLMQKIHSVYGNSAGGLTSLCFASDQVDMGAKLYWEDLSGTQYIRWSRLPKYCLRALSNALFRTSLELDPVFDIDYIENILRTTRKINFEAIRKNGMQLHMIVYNLSSSKHDYISIEDEAEMLPALRATAGGHPAYPTPTKIRDSLYIDGGTISDEFGVMSIVERHPDKEILCVFNNAAPRVSQLQDRLQKLAIAIVMLPLFGFRESFKTALSNFANVDMEKLKRMHPYVHFVANDLLGYQMSSDAKIRKMLYARGYELGREFLLSRELRTVEVPAK